MEMSSWKDRLREADEALARELSMEESQRLKRTVLAAVPAGAHALMWSLPFVLTAGSLTAAAVALVLSTVAAQPGATASPAGDQGIAAESVPARPPGGGRQQLQFATPGGTRIIWVFDAEFEVKGTLP
jgi:hypothetical protein